MLTLKNVSTSAAGRRLFAGVNLTIAKGERVVVVSRNSVATLIFGSHDVELIESLTDRVLEITDGRIVDHLYGYTELLRRRTEEVGVLVSA